MNYSGDVVYKSCHGRDSVYDIRYKNDNVLKPLLIFCHGFKGFKDWGHFNLISNELAKFNFIVLKFNFSFNGGTSKDVIDFPDLEAFSQNNYLKEVEDINYIISLCKNGGIELNSWNGEIFLLGHSRGGGMVTISGSRNKDVSKVVSWAGISDCISRLPSDNDLFSWKENGVRYIVNGRTKQNMPMKYQFVEVLIKNSSILSIKDSCLKMNKPYLIVHGTNDGAVSMDNARELNSWSPQSELFFIEGGNHVFGGKHPWLKNTLPDFTKKAIYKTVEFLLNKK